MPVFQSKKFRSSTYDSSVAAKYRAALSRHPFALFGLPFIATMVLGSFFLTPATALRYERYDRKVRQMTKEEELGMGKDRRKIDLAEEYYKLAAKDLDNWEQKRVKRLPGEHDDRNHGAKNLLQEMRLGRYTKLCSQLLGESTRW